MAVGASVLLPVAGTLTVAGMLTLLRAAGRARWGLAARRTARGPRARDPVLIAGSIPWVLAKSVIETAVLAPLLLAVGAGLAAAGAIAYRGTHTPPSWAAVAAAYTVVSCLGPRSRPARRELNRVFNALASTPLTAAMTLLTLAAVATTAASLILIKTPPLWPLHSLHGIHIPLPGLAPASLHG